MSLLDTIRTLQFGDSALPIGAFSFSGGLESAVAEGWVVDAERLEEFVRTARRQGALGDGVALLAAHRAATDGDLATVLDADAAVYERKLNDEAREASVRMGRKLGEVAVPLTDSALASKWLDAVQGRETPGTFPVGLGVVFAAMGADESSAFAVHQYGISSAITGAALRILRVDHSQTQTILYRVNADIDDEYLDASRRDIEEMSSFAPQIDVLSALHVRAHVRLFMS